MSRMQRWKMSVTGWVDGVLAQIENHEATVTAAISRVRQATARARVQLKRVGRASRIAARGRGRGGGLATTREGCRR
jgi:predicted transcriptional regulator